MSPSILRAELKLGLMSLWTYSCLTEIDSISQYHIAMSLKGISPLGMIPPPSPVRPHLQQHTLDNAVTIRTVEIYILKTGWLMVEKLLQIEC